VSAVLQNAPVLAPMRPEEIDAVMAIEQRAYPFPWTRANFADSLAAGYSAWTCRMEGELIGYAVMMLVLDEAHLLNHHRRAGLAARTATACSSCTTCSARRARHGAKRACSSRCGPSNAPGQALYRRLGFETIGRRRGYYPAGSGTRGCRGDGAGLCDAGARASCGRWDWRRCGGSGTSRRCRSQAHVPRRRPMPASPAAAPAG
jgi:ribosomal-protein-alanine N-acetyltransferase